MVRSSDGATPHSDSDHDDSVQAVDGRSARRDRNRLAVIDAAIELFSEGNLRPDPAAIALRCGLSPKSVSRYFQDLDALIGTAAARQMEQVFPLYQIHAIGQGPLDRRIDQFVRVRLEAYEVMIATFRAASLLALTQPEVQRYLDDARSLTRGQVEAHFAPELKGLAPGQRQSRVAAVDALFQAEALDYYRLHRGFSVALTRTMLADALSRLLEPQRQLDSESDPQRQPSRAPAQAGRSAVPSTRRRVASGKGA
jgi:TetR/AcrR family transcriptional regulator, regulator of autoinduction and epiphytic fitness